MAKRNSVLSKSGLTQDRLKELFSYDDKTGLFTWLVSFGHAKAGRVAGAVGPHGYRYIGVDAGFYKAHQLAWLYVTGEYPRAEIDHIDGNRDNNSFSNLRQALRQENMQNKKIYASNKSGFAGVWFHKQTNKWAASIQVAGSRKHLGLFDSPEAASAAYVMAKAKLHTFQPTLRSAA